MSTSFHFRSPVAVFLCNHSTTGVGLRSAVQGPGYLEITVAQLKKWNPFLSASYSFVGIPNEEEEEPEITTIAPAIPTTTTSIGNGVNPTVGANCETLWANTNICVGVIGATGTSSVPATTTTSTAGNSIATPPWGYFYGISFNQLLRINPAIGASCQSMWANTYLCVGTTTDKPTTTLITSTKPTTITTTTSARNGISTPQPIQTGIPTNYDKFHTVAIADKYSVSLNQFYAWNPAVGSGCATLWAGYNVCVHTVGAPTNKPTTTTVKTTSTSTGNGIATPTPTQPGIVGNCKRFHQVAGGDTYDTIASRYGTTSAKVRGWNTQINASCTNIWLGYYVCVGV
ncbi:carbohydrate-binding module family 50 protein [Copromyces sp. CBS 386.78]|nr:carbohydrate-binding module family 50 protein [Copromyces sp. CBS 386.78]